MCTGSAAAATDRARWTAVLALAALGCVAHVPRTGETTEFLERSAVFTTTASQQPLEGQVALHLLVYDGLSRPGLLDTGGFAWTIVGTMLLDARVFTFPSAPIRTPTYEPRAKLQLFDVRPLGRDRAGDASARRTLAPRLLGAVELGLGHRSNGQDGCALADHVRRPGPGNDFTACDPLTASPSTALNLKDGSFTTNFLFGNVYGKLLFPDAAGGPIRGSATAGAGVEWHVPCQFGTCMPEQMRVRYGPVVLSGLAEGELVVLRGAAIRLPLFGPVTMEGSLRATFQGAVHLGADRSPFGDFSAEVSYVPRLPAGSGVGLFARVQVGRDPLNIRFEQRFDAFIFGALFDPSPIERIFGAPSRDLPPPAKRR